MSRPAAAGRARRSRARSLLVALALVALACNDRQAEAPVGGGSDPRPNIVLVMAEDLSPRLGAYGDPVAHTPNLDRLAGEGTRFTRAFTTAGVCAPSRAAIITGVHQNDWGAGHMRAAGGGYAASPPPHVKAFPELLRAAGYHTINDGKTDYQMGLRFWGAYGGPDTIWDDDGSGDWRERPDGRPFFLYLNLLQTHESQVWPTWMMPDGWMPLALWPIRFRNHRRWPLETDPARVVVPPYYPDTPTVRADLARHYNNIAAVDASVGELLERLERDGLDRNTVVFFTSDHGDGLPRAKRWLYDSGLHVPLIVRGPGLTTPGSESPRLVSAVDLAPTMLSIAGLSAPEWMQGRAFLGPKAAPPRPYVYAARDRIDEQVDSVRAVRDERFKYIRHYRPELPYVISNSFRDKMPMMRELLALHEAGELSGDAALWFREARDPEELFDTAEDPHELRNLAEDPRHARTLDRLRGALDARLVAHEDLGLLPEAELRDRFFPDGEQPTTEPPEVVIENGVVRAAARTEGASIEIRVDGGPWRLYTRPVPIGPGQALAARAQRYGWRASELVVAE